MQSINWWKQLEWTFLLLESTRPGCDIYMGVERQLTGHIFIYQMRDENNFEEKVNGHVTVRTYCWATWEACSEVMRIQLLLLGCCEVLYALDAINDHTAICRPIYAVSPRTVTESNDLMGTQLHAFFGPSMNIQFRHSSARFNAAFHQYRTYISTQKAVLLRALETEQHNQAYVLRD